MRPGGAAVPPNSRCGTAAAFRVSDLVSVLSVALRNYLLPAAQFRRNPVARTVLNVAASTLSASSNAVAACPQTSSMALLAVAPQQVSEPRRVSTASSHGNVSWGAEPAKSSWLSPLAFLFSILLLMTCTVFLTR